MANNLHSTHFDGETDGERLSDCSLLVERSKSATHLPSSSSEQGPFHYRDADHAHRDEAESDNEPGTHGICRHDRPRAGVAWRTMVFQRPIIPQFQDGSEDDRPNNPAMTGETSSCKVELSSRSQNMADHDNSCPQGYLARAQEPKN